MDERHKIAFVIVQTLKQREGLPVPESLAMLDASAREKYLAVADAVLAAR
jgi:hypothetical protein